MLLSLGVLSLENMERSMPRKAFIKFIPAIPNKASGSSMLCPNFWQTTEFRQIFHRISHTKRESKSNPEKRWHVYVYCGRYVFNFIGTIAYIRGMCTIMDVLVSVTNQPSNKLYPSNLAVGSSDRRRKFPFIFVVGCKWEFWDPIN